MQTLVTTLGFALVSAAAGAQTVTYDYAKGTDFSKIKTYAWAQGTEELQDDLNHKRIVSAVDSQLSAKGLTKVAPDAIADVYVAYAICRSMARHRISADRSTARVEPVRRGWTRS